MSLVAKIHSQKREVRVKKSMALLQGAAVRGEALSMVDKQWGKCVFQSFPPENAGREHQLIPFRHLLFYIPPFLKK